jgi:hypothetical protein
MAVIVPSWFKGRQGKAEEVRPGLVKLNAPNLREWYLGIRRLDMGGWLTFLRIEPDGADTVAVEVDRMLEQEAWDAAFEVYRNQVII